VSDFFQPGAISTLHRLPAGNPDAVTEWFDALPAGSPLVVVLPAHVSELETPPFALIVRTLQTLKPLAAVVLVVNGATPETMTALRNQLANAAPRWLILNGDPTALQPYWPAGTPLLPGKGLNLWLGMAAARFHYPEARILCHDTDIASYGPELPARLAFPVYHEATGYHFAKGYYVRVAERLYGRVTRLFVTPLLRALVRVCGHSPFLDFLNSFRYILAGECALHPETVDRVRMPLGWGVEIGLLAEAFRHLEPRQICQIDLATNYQHKHQPFVTNRPGQGLARMSREIAVTLFHELSREGMRFDSAGWQALRRAYDRRAAEAVRRHWHDALYNGLAFHEAEERQLCALFAESLEAAVTAFQSGPPQLSAAPPIAEWLAEHGEAANHLLDVSRQDS